MHYFVKIVFLNKKVNNTAMLDWYLNKDQKYVNGTMPYRHFRFQQLILSDT